MLPAQGLRDPTPHLHITASDESQPPHTVELSNLAGGLAVAQRCLLKLLFDEEGLLACGGQKDTEELACFFSPPAMLASLPICLSKHCSSFTGHLLSVAAPSLNPRHPTLSHL